MSKIKPENTYREALLEEACSALIAACELLDKRFGSRRWRQDWTIADTTKKLDAELHGYDDHDAAEREAEDRRHLDGKPWRVWALASGAWQVGLEE